MAEQINKTVVIIDGKEYTITGAESEEYIHRVALRVNQRMQELKKGNSTLSSAMLAVLTAINICDDCLKCEDEVAALKKENETLKKSLKPVAKLNPKAR